MSDNLIAITDVLCSAVSFLKNEDFESFTLSIKQLKQKTHDFSEFYAQFQYLFSLKDQYLAEAKKLEEIKNSYVQLLENLSDFISLQQAESENYQHIHHGLEHGNECELFDFLSTARNCSLTRFAPAGYLPEQPIEPFRPPVPTEDTIRGSVLYKQQSFIDLLNETETSQPIQTKTLEHKKPDISPIIEDDSKLFPMLDLNP